MSQTTGSGQKMGKISGSHCLVLGCRNRQLLNQANTRSYFRFPRDADLCKKWVDFCNRPELYKKYDENGPEYLYKSSRICSDHFQPNDFNNPNLYSQGLKKGSIPTVNPASKEPKSASSPLNGVTTTVTTGNGAGGGGGGGGSGSSNGTGSPIDEKLLTAAVASMAGGGTPLPAEHLSLFYAAAIAAAAQAQAAASNHHSVPLNLKRTAPAPAAPTTNNNSSSNSGSNLQSSGVTSATSSTTATSTTPPAATGGGGSGPVSAKRNRAVPPLATPTGALANLIQRQQQIKEQQRKAAAAAAASHATAKQLSITPTTGGAGAAGVTTSVTRAPHSLVPIGNTTTTATTTPPSNGANGGGAAAAVAPPSSKRLTLNNNNNNVSNNNHQHQSQKPSLLGKRSSREDYNGSGSDYGINMMDIDTLSGAESSEGDSSNGPTSADEEYAAYRRQLKKVTRKVEEVIPLALKSQLTVTPANLGNSVSSTTTTTALSPTIGRSATTTINNNNIHNVNANGGGAVSPDDKDGGQVDYKQKYELTLKELFACRKIVKNQNKAMKQLQGEIDFLNLLLKEK
ncbi:mucin-19-like isoform X1 [Anopheles darlingi]|uniref:mucin-19-like isoform X1 n=1 Tax=Anopheles darlingi TaxID=43151 RepID=UPI002100281D|nr:mucin-19-like isoform X1 [Anopheles darlingi]